MSFSKAASVIVSLSIAALPAKGQTTVKHVASSPAPFDYFGISVKIEGDTAVVGATGVDGPVGVGVVYLLERQPSGWVETGSIVPTSPEYYADFGASLALEGDRLVVGAPASGSVYVFERSSGVFSQVARLVGSNTSGADRFGAAVALSGSTLLAGAPYEANPLFVSSPFEKFGAVYVFELVSGAWVETQKLDPALLKLGERYGWSVALLGDTAVVGAPQDPTKGLKAGAVFVWERSGGIWGSPAVLYSPFAGLGQEFGFALALDGDTLAASAPWYDLPGAPDAGRIHVYQRVGAAFQHALVVDNGAPVQDARFGSSLDLSAELLVAGVPTDGTNGSHSGRAEVHVRAGAEWPVLALDLPVGTTDAHVGNSVALDDGTIWIGSPGDAAGGTSSGAAYVVSNAIDGTLSAWPAKVSLSAGGTQALRVEAGAASAGHLHLLLGSITGTSPGVPLGSGLVLPLVTDAYWLFTLLTPNTPPLSGSFGVLDAGGGASPSFSVPAGSNPIHAGSVVYHADVVLDPSTGITGVTNAASVRLLP